MNVQCVGCGKEAEAPEHEGPDGKAFFGLPPGWFFFYEFDHQSESEEFACSVECIDASVDGGPQ